MENRGVKVRESLGGVKVRESLGGVKERIKGPVRERAGRGVGQGDAGAEGEWRFA